MIGFLEGKIGSLEPGRILLHLGGPEWGTLGYELRIPTSPSYQQMKLGESVSFYVQTHVKEDLFDLYGFLTLAEKQLFQTLLQVNGIGPRVALAVISFGAVSDLLHSIRRKDKTYLTQIPGIGKKTAERVVLELHETIEKKMKLGTWSDFSVESGPVPRDGSELYEEAKQALLSLGYKEIEVRKRLHFAFSHSPNAEGVEALLKVALQQSP